MKTNTLMVALVAVLAVLMFSVTSAFVDTTAANSENGIYLNINGVEVTSMNYISADTLAGFAGDTIPVRVSFRGLEDASDVKIKVEIYGGNEEYSDSTARFNVVNGTSYTKLLNVQLPKTLDGTTEDVELRVSIYNQADEFNAEYTLQMQRNSYVLDMISLDYDRSVAAGDSVPISVVIKNRGFENSEDGFVVVQIPELGVYAKGYFGDLVSVEDCDNGCDNEDAVQKVLSLRIPASAKDGTYDLVVKVYDDESVTTVKDVVKVSASTTTQIIAPLKSQNVRAGETKTYELILVNSGDNVAVYQLNAVSGSDLTVSVPSVVTVDAGSSKVVQVTVTVASDAAKGAYPFTVEANGQTAVLSANVSGKSVSASAIALTVILVIVFVVLLAVLIVLLSRKDRTTADEVETSYY
jgi:uncharacterized membrane protein